MTNLVKLIFGILNRDRSRWNDIVEMVKNCLGDNYSNSQDLYENYKKIRSKWTQKQQSQRQRIAVEREGHDGREKQNMSL